jgi:hypothetical protein
MTYKRHKHSFKNLNPLTLEIYCFMLTLFQLLSNLSLLVFQKHALNTLNSHLVIFCSLSNIFTNFNVYYNIRVQ